ncbi:ABC transporter substrate-binding protein [Marinococcus halotolerans]|uniref:ABC transporter substrate-binding protein n=1 Tax=Marinococcus halotolerans TaxID=301092 RepID=UPI0003B704D5|nr:ABC transporter substrate-binding protein [Marinococcus halotolerans]
MHLHKFIGRWAIFTAGAAILASCSSGENNSSADNTDSEEETRTYETEKGEVSIPSDPETIVTDYYAGELLAVDADVSGSGPDAFSNPFLEEQLNGAKNVGDPVDPEEVLELDPDLIVVMYDDNYEQLSEIAPTVHIPYNPDTDVQETLDTFGELTNNQTEAEDFKETIEETAADAKERLEGTIDEDDTFGIYELTENDELYVFGANGGRGGQAIYNALDLNAPEKIQEEVMGENAQEISMEVLEEYSSDHMFMTVYDPEDTGESRENIQESDIWANLEAVQNDQFYFLDFDTYYPYDPISVNEQIDLIADELTE